MKKKRPNAKDTRGKSGVPGQKGQGGEGLSHGYGGSAGEGTEPESRKRPKKNDEDFSPSLPSREKIAKVLR